ncbi:collagen alpha-1(I) chain-like [Ammospiza nelsoni]|uniref:collagen alpha-1(I) chain-like n=1 Tax=Ammospiza nelsoni TaxID=2857394 RepID=UPI00286C9564|nr:collagen alpha-1(I) chain-like [Ammospiza nelsoni]
MAGPGGRRVGRGGRGLPAAPPPRAAGGQRAAAPAARAAPPRRASTNGGALPVTSGPARPRPKPGARAVGRDFRGARRQGHVGKGRPRAHVASRRHGGGAKAGYALFRHRWAGLGGGTPLFVSGARPTPGPDRDGSGVPGVALAATPGTPDPSRSGPGVGETPRPTSVWSRVSLCLHVSPSPHGHLSMSQHLSPISSPSPPLLLSLSPPLHPSLHLSRALLSPSVSSRLRPSGSPPLHSTLSPSLLCTCPSLSPPPHTFLSPHLPLPSLPLSPLPPRLFPARFPLPAAAAAPGTRQGRTARCPQPPPPPPGPRGCPGSPGGSGGSSRRRGSAGPARERRGAGRGCAHRSPARPFPARAARGQPRRSGAGPEPPAPPPARARGLGDRRAAARSPGAGAGVQITPDDSRGRARRATKGPSVPVLAWSTPGSPRRGPAATPGAAFYLFSTQNKSNRCNKSEGGFMIESHMSLFALRENAGAKPLGGLRRGIPGDAPGRGEAAGPCCPPAAGAETPALRRHRLPARPGGPRAPPGPDGPPGPGVRWARSRRAAPSSPCSSPSRGDITAPLSARPAPAPARSAPAAPRLRRYLLAPLRHRRCPERPSLRVELQGPLQELVGIVLEPGELGGPPALARARCSPLAPHRDRAHPGPGAPRNPCATCGHSTAKAGALGARVPFLPPTFPPSLPEQPPRIARGRSSPLRAGAGGMRLGFAGNLRET